MIFIYIGIITVACIPLSITIKRILKYRQIKTQGMQSQARIIQIEMVPFFKGTRNVRLTLQFEDTKTYQLRTATAITPNAKRRVGDILDIAYEENNPKVYVIGDEKGYYPMLGFAIFMFIFSLIAVYGIHDMVQNGY